MIVRAAAAPHSFSEKLATCEGYRIIQFSGEQVIVIDVVFPNSHRKSVQHVLQEETCSGTVPP